MTGKASGGPGPFAAQYRLTSIGLVGQVTLIAFESLAVATAMPTVVKSLHGLELFGWTFTAFAVTNVIGMVCAGLWCDRHGPRRSIFWGLIFFALGLVVAGTSSGMATFIAGRALQGFGGGQMIVAVYVIIGTVYPSEVRARIFGLVSAAWVLPALIGPVIAGFLAAHGLWRVIFLGLLPLLAAAALSLRPAMRTLHGPDVQPPRNYGRLLYAVATASGLAIIQYATQRASDGFQVIDVPILAAGIGLLIVGLRVLWPAGTVALRRGVPAVVMFRGLFFGAFVGMESLLPLTLTTLHGYSPTVSGLPLLVGSVGWSAGSAIQGRWQAPRHQIVRLGAVLVTICAVGLLALVLMSGAGWVSYPLWILAGLGMGLAMSSIGVLLLDFSKPEERGNNSAAVQISDATGNAVCIGLGGSLVAASTHGLLTFSAAIAVQNCLMAALIFVAVLGAGRLRQPELVTS